MRLTKNRLKGADTYEPSRKLRGGADGYFVYYTDKGDGLAFTPQDIVSASSRFTKLDEGDPEFPHRWTILSFLLKHLGKRYDG